MDSRDKEINPGTSAQAEAVPEKIPETIPETEEPSGGKKKKKRIGIIKRVKDSGFFNLTMKIYFAVFFAAVIIYLLSRWIPGFAEFWSRYPSVGIRFVLAKLTGWIPFSLAEVLLVSLPVTVIWYLIASSVSTKRDNSMRNFNRWLRPAVCLILTVFIIFFAGFGTAYGRRTIGDNLGLERGDITAQDLYDTASTIAGKLNELTDEINFDGEGASVMPYGYDEMIRKVNEAYEKFAADADFITHFDTYAKPVALSYPMTFTHISGVYTFFTGEANVNVNYPDFINPYTVAHEMSHQRGIAREDEANFAAFLVCIASDDVYVRYSGYANMLRDLTTALSAADFELYALFRIGEMPQKLDKEFAAFSDFFDEYRDSTASKISQGVNDTFLKSQGQSAGSKSYGLVVDLAVSYYKSGKM